MYGDVFRSFRVERSNLFFRNAERCLNVKKNQLVILTEEGELFALGCDSSEVLNLYSLCNDKSNSKKCTNLLSDTIVGVSPIEMLLYYQGTSQHLAIVHRKNDKPSLIGLTIFEHVYGKFHKIHHAEFECNKQNTIEIYVRNQYPRMVCYINILQHVQSEKNKRKTVRFLIKYNESEGMYLPKTKMENVMSIWEMFNAEY